MLKKLNNLFFLCSYHHFYSSSYYAIFIRIKSFWTAAMMELKEPIPICYQHWAEGNRNLFIKYVRGYIAKNRHGYEVVKITDKGRFAVLRKKG